jgi:hypothetical protein
MIAFTLKLAVFWWFWIWVAKNPAFPNPVLEVFFWGMVIAIHIMWWGRVVNSR